MGGSAALLGAVISLPAAAATVLAAWPRLGERPRRMEGVAAGALGGALGLVSVLACSGPTFAQLPGLRFQAAPAACLQSLVALGVAVAAVVGGRLGEVSRARWMLVSVLYFVHTALGAAFAADLSTFVVFFEGSVLPLFAMVGLSGASRRGASGLQLAGALGAGSTLVLWAAAQPTPTSVGFWALTLGFGIRAAWVPLHAWLPRAVEGPPAGALALILGPALVMGVDGYLRFAAPLASEVAATRLAWAGAASFLYCALVASTQLDLAKRLAYGAASPLGAALVGAAISGELGSRGARLLLLAQPLATGAVVLLVGRLMELRGGRRLSDYGGLATRAPRWTAALGLAGLAAAGLAPFSGLGARLLLGAGVLRAPRLGLGCALLLALGWLVSAGHLVRLFARLTGGPPPEEAGPTLEGRTVWVAVLLLAGSAVLAATTLESLPFPERWP